MARCFWCNENNPLYVKYHDEEWGIERLDDAYLFEMLLLESFQAGLSWECVLNKRENFRAAFNNFDFEQIKNYGQDKIEELMADKGIIRNRRKIEAAIQNAGIFADILQECGSFANYLKKFWDGETIFEHTLTRSDLSDRLSRDLSARGMKFVGTTIIYSYLQAIGIINSHEPSCFLYLGNAR